MMLSMALWGMTDSAKASGWPLPKKKVQIIPSYYHYTATAYRTDNGNKIDFGNNGRYTGQTFKLGIEYAISDQWALAGNIPFAANHYASDVLSNNNSGLSDLEVGVKYNFFADPAKRNFLSGQITAILPAYSNNITKQPYLGFARTGMEFRLMYSGSTRKSYNFFHNTELAYRRFSSSQLKVNQLQVLSTLGYYLSEKDILTGDVSGTFSNGNINGFSATNPLQNTDFNFLKMTMQYGRKISKDCWLYGGLFSDVHNRNAGIGKGFTVFAIIQL